MKDALAVVAFLAALLAAVVIYVAGTKALGVPMWLATAVLVGLCAGGLGWAVKRWP